MRLPVPPPRHSVQREELTNSTVTGLTSPPLLPKIHALRNYYRFVRTPRVEQSYPVGGECRMTDQKKTGTKKNLRLKRETLRDLSVNLRKGSAEKVKGGGRGSLSYTF